MQVVINPAGVLRHIYDETLDLSGVGKPDIRRASHVEPDAQGRWFADLAPVAGPRLGPFLQRSQALAAEHAWLENHWLDPRG